MMFQLTFDGGTPLSATAMGFGWLPALGVIVGILLIGVLIAFIIRLRRPPELIGMTPERVKEVWKEIDHLSGQGIMGAKLSVVEADKLLDGVLKAMMMPGESLGERLKTAAYKHPQLREVWPAHKLRNQLVHDSSFELTTGAAKRALKSYEAALRSLHVL